MVAAVATRLLPALKLKLPFEVMLLPTSWLALPLKKLAPPPVAVAKSVVTVLKAMSLLAASVVAPPVELLVISPIKKIIAIEL